MHLIRDEYNRLCVLGDRCPEPSPEWKKLQKKPVGRSSVWYTAYPLDGGAINAQQGKFAIVGEVTPEHMDRYFYRCRKGGAGTFNPAADTVISLWEKTR